jgi:hypothetical protein
MVNKYILILLLTVVIFSCKSPEYLPSMKDVGINSHGSYIQLYTKDYNYIDGELIAVDSNYFYILTKLKKTDSLELDTISFLNINSISLQYAKTKNYGWCIPIALLLPGVHGYFFIFTAPLHLLVTIPVAISGSNAYKLRKNELTLENMKMFSRFPQGIPPGITMDMIK